MNNVLHGITVNVYSLVMLNINNYLQLMINGFVKTAKMNEVGGRTPNKCSILRDCDVIIPLNTSVHVSIHHVDLHWQIILRLSLEYVTSLSCARLFGGVWSKLSQESKALNAILDRLKDSKTGLIKTKRIRFLSVNRLPNFPYSV